MGWAPDYITPAQLAAYLRILDMDDDLELGVAVTAASRAIDDHCNRQFGLVAAPEARQYQAWYDYTRATWVVDVDDFQTETGLAVSIGGTLTTAFTKEPINAAIEGKPWYRLRFDYAAAVVPVTPTYLVDATARWGWTTTPGAVPLAARLQASRFHARRDSPFGIAGSPDLGNELRLLQKLDADVAVLLRGLGRPRRVG
jgi:hypothetical protein